ncbi:MAG: hypothetical protein SGPRY_009773 [Prymnesium sp.]
MDGKQWMTKPSRQFEAPPTFDHGCRNNPPSPFPTGPLAIFSRPLARALLVSCGHVSRWVELMRERNRRADGCARGHPLLTRTMEATSCDGALAGWLGACELNVTLASMTWTKSHWYWRGGDRTDGFVQPDASSVVVHGLKSSALETWLQVHNVSSAAKETKFPPLLWRYEGSRHSYTQLHPEQHAWYWKECGAYGCHRSRNHEIPRYVAVGEM